MKQGSVELPQAEGFVDCSKSIVIDCRCGENLLLLGREGRTAF
jgi:hypothetical protein